MRDKPAQENRDLIPISTGSLTGRSSRLIQRGLNDFEQAEVALDQVRKAQTGQRAGQRDFQGLSDDAVKLALEKPAQWKLRLLFTVIIDEIENYKSLRQAGDAQAVIDVRESIPLIETKLWIINRLKDLFDLINILRERFCTINQVIDVPGESGDILAIILWSRQFSLVYKQIFELSIRCRAVTCDPIYEEAFCALLEYYDDKLWDFESFATSSMAIINELIALPSIEIPCTVNLTLQFPSDSNYDKLISALDSDRVKAALLKHSKSI